MSEDRKRFGLVLDRSIGFNLSLHLRRLSRYGLLDAYVEDSATAACTRRWTSPPRGVDPACVPLGGNQQKVVLGRALMTGPRVIFLDEPTRGIDVGAKAEVYQLMNRLTDEGRAIVLVSSELPELMGMSDAILMLSEGRVSGRFGRKGITQEALMAAAMGQRPAVEA